MNRTVCIFAFAGLVTQASAQNYILRIEGGPQQVNTSSGSVSITLDVIGDAEEGLGTHMLWGSFALESIGSAVIEDISWTHADWSEFNIDGGYDGLGAYNRIEFGQWEGSGFIPRSGSELGQLIGQFQITLAQSDIASGMLDFRLLQSSSYALSTIDIDTGASYYSTPEDLVLEGFSTVVVPAPSSAMIVLSASLLSIRRRR
ncbi:MAG: hypothetical protein P1U42_05670 [Phycisphaerales bacterium]|nr:hypothetical protein [Phycisphaerales bacterium]